MCDYSSPIPRLGIKRYNWWNEALHGVGRAGLATVFPQAIGMAATFDDCAVRQAFECVSDEARAKYHHSENKEGSERYQGLTFWTPGPPLGKRTGNVWRRSLSDFSDGIGCCSWLARTFGE